MGAAVWVETEVSRDALGTHAGNGALVRRLSG
jgi:hypothetical protein